jgi:Ca2+-binding EF-hand superfamily protein
MLRWLRGCIAVLVVGLALSSGAAQEPKKPLDADAIFKKLDANNDGKLTRDEFLKLADRFKNKEKARVKLAMVFDKIDPDNQGLTKEQFRVYLESTRKKEAVR